LGKLAGWLRPQGPGEPVFNLGMRLGARRRE
jgi:hypothetical protein